MSKFLDRKYPPDEIARLAAKIDHDMGDIPSVVLLAAHVSAAYSLLESASEIGSLPLEFKLALHALRVNSELFLLVCEAGPVPHKGRTF